MSEMEQYSRYFPVGMKVGVGIPLPNADVFRDWAIILDCDEDLIALQLSRDMLPVSVSLRYGQILELRGGGDTNGYCCRGIIVSEDDARVLLLRLIGEIASDESREFYRIDAFLPIKYYVSREQNVEKLRLQWEQRREQRQRSAASEASEEQPWNSRLPAEDAELPYERLQDHEDEYDGPVADAEGRQSTWDTIIPLAANISGGGLRLNTHQVFENGEYTLVEVFVPYPQRVVDIVARVIFSNRISTEVADRDYFNTGMQFVYVDERDRDAIVTYISTIQLKRIRQLREQYLFREGAISQTVSGSRWGLDLKKLVAWMAATAVLVLVAVLLFNYFRQYAQGHPKGEIEQTFEGGLRKYIELHKKP